jgi:PKD repeat protein/type II secretory pathway pseudopilin PulG
MELLVVIGVLGVLGTVAVGVHQWTKSKAARAALMSDANLLATAQQARLSLEGSYAATLDELMGDGLELSTRTVPLGVSAEGSSVTMGVGRTDLSGLCLVHMTQRTTASGPSAIYCDTSPANQGITFLQMGQTLQFDATALLTSSSPWGPTAAWAQGGGEARYVWSFGDGTGRVGSQTDAGIVTHTYQGDPTNYTVMVGVLDTQGRFRTATLTTPPIGNPSGGGQPTANFTISPSGAITVGQELILNGASSLDADGQITSYVWSLPTGQVGGPTTRFRVTDPGPITISLTVTDNDNKSHTVSRTVDVTGQAVANGAPVAIITATPNPAVVGRPLLVDASQSRDPSGRLTQVEWTLTPLTGAMPTSPYDQPGTLTGSMAATGMRASFQPTSVGNYRLRAKLVSSTGQRTVQEQTVRVVPPNDAPSFSVTPGLWTTRVGLPVTLRVSGALDTNATVRWRMGDGTSLAGVAVSHAYQTPGTYTVEVVAADSTALRATSTATIVVEPNLLPTANFVVTPATRTVGTTITFDATSSTDPDGTIVFARWLWSDGQYATGMTTQRTFNTPGTYMVTLTVQDDARGQHSISYPIEILAAQVAPTAGVLVPTPIIVGVDGVFDASSSQDADGMIVRYVWAWSNGSVDTTATPFFPKRFPTEGSTTLNLTVTDNDGLTATTVATFDVIPGLVVTATADVTGPQINDLVTFTVSATGGSGPVTYEWDFGDGTAPVITTDPTITHRYTADGTRQATVVATQSSTGLTGSDQVTITVGNAPPAAPVAQLSVPSPTRSTDPLLADGRGSTSPSDPVTVWSWTVNGGAPSDNATGTLPLDTLGVGEHTISLRVQTSGGVWSDPIAVTVARLGLPSLSCPAGPYAAGSAHTITVTGSSVPAGYAVVYDWRFNGVPVGGSTATLTFTPATGGTLEAGVTDPTGQRTSCTMTVTSGAVTATILPKPARVGRFFQRTVVGYPGGAAPLTRSWAWSASATGPWTSVTGVTALARRGGTLTLTPNEDTVRVTGTVPDTIFARYSVADAGAQQASDVVALIIDNAAPYARILTPSAGLVGLGPLSYEGEASDPEGDPVTVEWRWNGASLGNSTLSGLMDILATTPEGVLELIVTDSYGASTSDAITLTPIPPLPLLLLAPTCAANGATTVIQATATSGSGFPLTLRLVSVRGGSGTEHLASPIVMTPHPTIANLYTATITTPPEDYTPRVEGNDGSGPVTIVSPTPCAGAGPSSPNAWLTPYRTRPGGPAIRLMIDALSGPTTFTFDWTDRRWGGQSWQRFGAFDGTPRVEISDPQELGGAASYGYTASVAGEHPVTPLTLASSWYTLRDNGGAILSEACIMGDPWNASFRRFVTDSDDYDVGNVTENFGDGAYTPSEFFNTTPLLGTYYGGKRIVNGPILFNLPACAGTHATLWERSYDATQLAANGNVPLWTSWRMVEEQPVVRGMGDAQFTIENLTVGNMSGPQQNLTQWGVTVRGATQEDGGGPMLTSQRLIQRESWVSSFIFFAPDNTEPPPPAVSIVAYGTETAVPGVVYIGTGPLSAQFDGGQFIGEWQMASDTKTGTIWTTYASYQGAYGFTFNTYVPPDPFDCGLNYWVEYRLVLREIDSGLVRYTGSPLRASIPCS